MRTPNYLRILGCGIFLSAALALGQAPSIEQIVVNQNRVAAGHLEQGSLTVQLELRAGTWHPEAEDGPALFVQAFGEAGRAAQIPGPLLRMPTGTTVHATVTNKLKDKATVYGLDTRPGDVKAAGLELAAGESRTVTFLAGAPGTYFYWARTVTPVADGRPQLADATLTGAFIVDPAGTGFFGTDAASTGPGDRVFVIGALVLPADSLHEDFEIVTINGKSYPYTEPLEYSQGDLVRCASLIRASERTRCTCMGPSFRC